MKPANYIFPLKYSLLIGLVCLLLACSKTSQRNSLKPVSLKCNYRNNPLGTDIRKPMFSWEVADTSKGGVQSAYQIIVASQKSLLRERNPDIWNSGKVKSPQSNHITFDGQALEPATRYYWQVRIWDENGNRSPYSAIQWFETGRFSKRDWEAQWISTSAWEDSIPPELPAPYFRKTFQIENQVDQGRCYISGLGYYEIYINGKRVGNHQLDPALTRYDRRVKYVTHEVGEFLKEGINVMVVKLGNGWYNQHSPSAWDFHEAPWRNSPALLCQLNYRTPEGKNHEIISDSTWHYTRGPVEYHSIRNGEFYNAGKYNRRWFLPGFNDRNWPSAIEMEGPEGTLSAQKMPPMKITRTLSPQKIIEPEQGTYIFDFGQNIAGWTLLNVRGDSGRVIKIAHGERLYEDGTLDQEEISRFVFEGLTQTNQYTLAGEGKENWEPSFSYHGFRYASVTGLPNPPHTGILKARVVHTAFDTAGTFASSDTLLNRLHKNTLWSFLGNFHGYPEDCPHREKIGWSGDAQAVDEMGLWNFHATTAYKKWLDDFWDEQQSNGRIPGIIPTSGWGYTYGSGPAQKNGYGPQWEGAFVTIPWQLYLYKGDSSILSSYYGGIKAYLEYLERNARDNILNFGINDHKYPGTPTGPPIIASAYYYHLTKIMGKMAGILGHQEDQAYYNNLAPKIKAAFNNHYFQAGSNAYGNGGQTSLALALYFGLVPEGRESPVLNTLIRNINNHDQHFDTGVVGTQCLINVLIDNGLTDLAYTMITQTSYPGYGDWIERGATTLWQTWQGNMSRNHIMFGSVDEWFYEGLAGIKIDPENPGFKHFFLKPQAPEALDYAKASHHSMFGKIESGWQKTAEGINYNFTIPFNTSATITLPVEDGQSVIVNGENVTNHDHVKVIGKEKNKILMQVGSGEYKFVKS